MITIWIANAVYISIADENLWWYCRTYLHLLMWPCTFSAILMLPSEYIRSTESMLLYHIYTLWRYGLLVYYYRYSVWLFIIALIGFISFSLFYDVQIVCVVYDDNSTNSDNSSNNNRLSIARQRSCKTLNIILQDR